VVLLQSPAADSPNQEQPMKRDSEKTTPFVKDDPRLRPPAAPGRAMALGPQMFGNFEASKNIKMPAWALPLIGSIVIIYAVVLVGAWVKSIWDVEQLERPKNSVDLAIGAPPPPPPPPPKGGVKPKDVQITPKKVKVKDIVQPVKIEKQEVAAPVEVGDPNGVEGGVEGGVAGGDLNGVVAAPPPPPPPPPPPAPQTVTPAALDALRIAGEKNIVPDDVTKTEISRSGKDRIVGTYRVCVTTEGNVSVVAQMKSTGFPAYDSKITNTIRGEWRYRPFVGAGGKPVPACTAVTFIYSQH
jgi:protein TonB